MGVCGDCLVAILLLFCHTGSSFHSTSAPVALGRLTSFNSRLEEQNARFSLLKPHHWLPSWSSSSTSSSIVLRRFKEGDEITADFLDDDEDDSVDDKDSVKKRLSQLYSAGKYLFGSYGLTLLLMPDRTFTALLQTKVAGAAGFGIAAGLCHILQGANANDRLTSDTYKRLNIGLLGFSVLGFFGFPGEAAFHPSAGAAMLLTAWSSLLRVFGTAVSYVGLRQGVKYKDAGAKAVMKDVILGMKGTMKGLKVQNSKKALTYRNCLLLVALGIFSNVMDTIFMIQFMDTFKKSWFQISLPVSAVARLFMISTMIYSLKDAAERDRLTGTTFIQLNLMVGLWSTMVAIGQAIRPFGFEPHRGVEMFAFSLPFFIRTLKSQNEKTAKKLTA